MADVTAWRSQILDSILRVLLVAGVIVAGPTAIYALTTGRTTVAILDFAALCVVTYLAFAGNVRFRARVLGLIGTCGVLGFFLLISVGLIGQVFLLGACVLAALLLGLRVSLYSLAVVSVAMVIIGLTGSFQSPLELMGIASTGEWIILTANFTFVTGVLCVSCAVLLRRLEHSLRSEQSTARSLAHQRAKLSTANEELATEVAQRARAEAASRRLAQAVSQAVDPILIGDESGQITYANNAALVLQKRIGVSTPWRWLNEVTGAAIDRGQPDEVNASSPLRLTFVAVDGEQLDFDAGITAFEDEQAGSDAFVAVLRDLTAERQMQARLRHAEKLEALGTFAAGTAHDFNNILGSVLLVAEAAREDATDPAQRTDLGAIIAACDRARDLVEKLNNFGGHPMDGRTPISMRATIGAAEPLLRASLPRRVTFITQFTGDGHVHARASEIDQILVNLVANAGQAVQDRPNARIMLVLNPPSTAADDNAPAAADEVILSVSDTGPGIESAVLDRIFDPFFTTKPPSRGSGLGLASVYGIVTSLGGDIEVETELGLGTTFRILLPTCEP